MAENSSSPYATLADEAASQQPSEHEFNCSSSRVAKPFAALLVCSVLLAACGFAATSRRDEPGKQYVAGAAFLPPLRGITKSVWNSLSGKYGAAAIDCYWDMTRGNYSWSAPFAKATGAELGWGMYLEGPEIYVDSSTNRWAARGFIATRVDALNHSMCCCQYLAGGDTTFTLTEYCKATVPGLDKPVPEVCAAYMSPPCPADNKTAHAMTWDTPMYIEEYSTCMVPLPTVVPLSVKPDDVPQFSAATIMFN
eukprot:TRINITY_DN10956_c0_g1_i1.p1 TRINITY_DN10956_c0_g1~~TRINITY_DN10956_c0_g1_i1.p1  ORF type:complete len:252 (-),score=37.40 TRINITY_DN10956_c0_g1_i1:511-1266(-)